MNGKIPWESDLKSALAKARKEVITVLDRLVKEYKSSDSAPEAIYYGEVSRYRDTKNPALSKVGLRSSTQPSTSSSEDNL